MGPLQANSAGRSERVASVAGDHVEAPALLRRQSSPPVILLDEATSAIDSARDATFRTVRAVVKKQNKAVLTIAHRLATARDADRVVVLDRGRVVEAGSPTTTWHILRRIHSIRCSIRK